MPAVFRKRAIQWCRLGRLLMSAAVLALNAALARAQQPALPAVNLGDTSFLDALARPGGLVEEIGQGAHDNRSAADNGAVLPQATDINSGVSLTHLAWISHAHLFGAWYGIETVLSAAYVDTGGHGVGGGFGDVTLGPVILQWPEHRALGMRVDQRVVLDLDAPVGRYSVNAQVNVGSGAWDVHPYYAVTFLGERWESSWRVHYLWDGRNNAPPASLHAASDQAGQAVHFNGTLAYRMHGNFYLGANGYYLRQITDNRINGIPIAGTQQIGAIGPGLVMQHQKWFYYVDTYHEFGARNMAEGNKYVLRIARVF